MPLYEYECQTCRHRFERIQRFSDPPIASCPECGNDVRKLVSSPAIQFKGSGWYITDYARKGDAGNGGKAKDGDKSAGSSASDAAASPSADAAAASKQQTGTEAKPSSPAPKATDT